MLSTSLNKTLPSLLSSMCNLADIGVSLLLKGPEDDQDEESSLSVTELKEQRDRQKLETDLLRQAGMQEEQLRSDLEKQRLESEGCSWGIGKQCCILHRSPVFVFCVVLKLICFVFV